MKKSFNRALCIVNLLNRVKSLQDGLVLIEHYVLLIIKLILHFSHYHRFNRALCIVNLSTPTENNAILPVLIEHYVLLMH